MTIKFDEAKSSKNVRHRGLPFSMVADFQWETALVIRDDRRDYGEERSLAFGAINSELYALVFTVRDDNIRVISLRRANRKERKRWSEKLT